MIDYHFSITNFQWSLKNDGVSSKNYEKTAAHFQWSLISKAEHV